MTARKVRRCRQGNIMGDGLSDIELLVTKLDLEQKRVQLQEKDRHVQPHGSMELRAVHLLIEKLRLEKMRDTLKKRRAFEQGRQPGRVGFIRAL